MPNEPALWPLQRFAFTKSRFFFLRFVSLVVARKKIYAILASVERPSARTFGTSKDGDGDGRARRRRVVGSGFIGQELRSAGCNERRRCALPNLKPGRCHRGPERFFSCRVAPARMSELLLFTQHRRPTALLLVLDAQLSGAC